MKRSFYILFLLFPFYFLACYDNKKEEKEAHSYYQIAYQHYLEKNLKEAQIILDSLHIKFPNSENAKYQAMLLQRSIDKDKCMNSIDSLSEIINHYKIEKIKLERSAAKQREIDSIQVEIDRLEKQKNPFRNIYNNIRTKELTECQQCQVYMRNIRQ